MIDPIFIVPERQVKYSFIISKNHLTSSQIASLDTKIREELGSCRVIPNWGWEPVGDHSTLVHLTLNDVSVNHGRFMKIVREWCQELDLTPSVSHV